ncbi:hypothetical protein Y032_0387g471 [Ancylostoma ceylanicum]|uniref:Uncharacterized protein n=1 Tax=Ancylostoma ceylanicum TaxID=53326 RepID=A0A016RSL9_9BILA|nr:hypothetical protein Y032_0387g471 [Ancylostoma ceylanicum]
MRNLWTVVRPSCTRIGGICSMQEKRKGIMDNDLSTFAHDKMGFHQCASADDCGFSWTSVSSNVHKTKWNLVNVQKECGCG